MIRLISVLCSFFAITLIITADSITAKQRVLIYTKTAGFRHASIPDGIKAFEKLGKKHDIHMYNTEDEEKFEDEEWVNGWDAMIFLSVSGTMLNDKGAVNMMKYIENGGGFMGVHEACDAMYKSPWYGRLVGAYFDYHPYMQRFTLDVQTHDHPSTSFLNKTWEVYDEIYTFNSNPRDLGKTVVLTADSKSFKDPTGPGLAILRKTEGVHPIAWYAEGGLLDESKKNPGGGVMDNSKTPKNQRGSGGAGRAFYTGLGHTHACWKEDNMIQHVWGGLKWVLDSPAIRSNNASLPASAPGTKFVVKDSKTTSNNSSSTSQNVGPTVKGVPQPGLSTSASTKTIIIPSTAAILFTSLLFIALKTL